MKLMIANGIKEKKYLRMANEKIPAGWKILETHRIAGSGHPTFSLYLVKEGGDVLHMWPIIKNMPRRILREFIKIVEIFGFKALFDPSHGSYTALIGVQGYEEETEGLEEALKTVNSRFYKSQIDILLEE